MGLLWMAMDHLPKLTLPKEVSIRNERLNLMFYFMYIPVLAYGVYTFYTGRSYSSTIPNDPQLMVKPTWKNLDPSFYAKATVLPRLASECEMFKFDGNCTAAMMGQACFTLEPDAANYNEAKLSFNCRKGCAQLEGDLCFNPAMSFFAEGSLTWKALLNEATYTNNKVKKTLRMEITPNMAAVYLAELNFTYTFKLSRTIPWFFGVENQVLSAGTNTEAVTVVVRPDHTVCKVFKPNDHLLMDLTSVSEAAGLSVNVPDSMYGLQLMARVNCFTDEADIPVLDWTGHTRQYPSLLKPMCVLSNTVISRDVSSWTVINSTHTRLTAWWFLSVQPGTSYHRVPSTAAITTMMISILVLLGLPAKIVKTFMLRMLGPLSKVYNRLFLQAFSIDENMRQMLSKLISSGTLFQNLGEIDENGAQISRERLNQGLEDVFRCHGYSVPRGQMKALVNLTLNKPKKSGGLVQMLRGKTKSAPVVCDGMTHSLLAEYLAADGVLSLDLLRELIDADRQKSMLEKAFTPKPLRIIEEATRSPDKSAQDDDDKVDRDVPRFLKSKNSKSDQVELDELHSVFKLQMGELEARLEQKMEARFADLQAQLDSKVAEVSRRGDAPVWMSQMLAQSEEAAALQPMLAQSEEAAALQPLQKKNMHHVNNFGGPESSEQHLKGQLDVLQGMSDFSVGQIRALEANFQTFEERFRILETNSDQVHLALRAIQATSVNHSKSFLRLREDIIKNGTSSNGELDLLDPGHNPFQNGLLAPLQVEHRRTPGRLGAELRRRAQMDQMEMDAGRLRAYSVNGTGDMQKEFSHPENYAEHEHAATARV